MNAFTGIKDADRLILESIENERDFLSACLTNKYLYGLCDENVFRKRIMKKYSSSLYNKPSDMSYRKFYLQLLYYIDKLKDEYGFNFTSGDPIAYYDLLNRRMLYYAKIKNAIEFGYTDLALFLSERKDFIHNSMIKKMFFTAAKSGNKILLDYFLKKGDLGEYEYEKAAKLAEMSGHFELGEYLKNLKV